MTHAGSNLEAAKRVADAVLFEGYILYPYRSTSAKNQLRWQFGMLGPVGAAQGGVGEEAGMHTTLLVEPDAEVTLDLTLRFLHPQFRAVERAAGSDFEPVSELSIGDTRWVPWHEAVVCEIPLPGIISDTVIPIEIAGGEDIELLPAGRLVRTRQTLRGEVRISWRALDADRPLTAITVGVENLELWGPPAEPSNRAAARELAASKSFAGTHLLAHVSGGRFLSRTDPPPWAAPAAATADQHRCWPVLLGPESGPHDLLLVSPIILSDHPAIAPESPGDFFDATEIDEMLALRVQTLTDDEKAQARGTDPRAAQIIDRCDTMTDATLAGLHGAVRTPETPWWDPAADASVAPETDAVHVAGVAVAKGSSVRLRPVRRADAQDMFLAGQTATVAAVLRDVDGATHVAVTLDADPGNDLHAWYGRYHYFAPEELEPLR